MPQTLKCHSIARGCIAKIRHKNCGWHGVSLLSPASEQYFEGSYRSSFLSELEHLSDLTQVAGPVWNLRWVPVSSHDIVPLEYIRKTCNHQGPTLAGAHVIGRKTLLFKDLIRCEKRCSDKVAISHDHFWAGGGGKKRETMEADQTGCPSIPRNWRRILTFWTK